MARKKPHGHQKELVVRPTAMALALQDALESNGIDTSHAKLPMKREPIWTVTRRRKKRR